MVEGPVRLVRAVVDKERFGGVRLDEGLERRQRDDVVEPEDALRSDVELAAARRAVASLGEHRRKAPHVRERAEMMVLVLVAVLPVAMVVHAGQQDRSARAATRRRRERVGEANALRRELVEAGCRDDAIAIRANGLAAVIVRDEEHDVALRSVRGRGDHRQCQGQRESSQHSDLTTRRRAAVRLHCGLTGKRRSMSGSPSRTLLRCASASAVSSRTTSGLLAATFQRSPGSFPR